MRRLMPVAAAVALAALAGCGSGNAKVKGKLVENGQPVEVHGQASLLFYPVSPDGKPSERSYVAGLNPDGTFELLASGGELPPGTYLVGFEMNDAKMPGSKAPSATTTAAKTGGNPLSKYKGKFTAAASPIKRELKPGGNDLTIDLANPSG